jgi:1,4-dihydroxy-2-naphthoate octaprenyltransferase
MGLGPGLLSVGLLTVNNLRDIDEDRAAGKKSLAVRFGAGFARFEYLACVVGACFLAPLAVYLETANRLLLAASLVTLAFGMPGVVTVYTETDAPALNGVLARTGRLLLVYGIVFSAAWLL